jgi:uncharacterized protein (DUF1330 family)
MPAYLIVDIEVTDPERYKQYIEVVPATIAAYGGKYLARGGETAVLEGDWEPQRVVVLEFESLERIKEWWESDDYRAPKLLRQSASVAKIVAVEGT